jgi:hypothetical protein
MGNGVYSEEGRAGEHGIAVVPSGRMVAVGTTLHTHENTSKKPCKPQSCIRKRAYRGNGKETLFPLQV